MSVSVAHPYSYNPAEYNYGYDIHSYGKRSAEPFYGHGPSSASVSVSVAHPYSDHPAQYNYGYNIHSYGKRSAEPYYGYGGSSYVSESRPYYSYGYGVRHY